LTASENLSHGSLPFAAHEAVQSATISQRDSEILSLQAQLGELAASIAGQVQQAVIRREEELRSAVLEYEKVVESRVLRREEEVMEAVRTREAELLEAWQRNEAIIRAACEAELEERWRIEQDKLQRMREEIEAKARAIEESQPKGTYDPSMPLGCGPDIAHRTEKRQNTFGRSEEHPCTTRTADQ
jgi:hypothetical protein